MRGVPVDAPNEAATAAVRRTGPIRYATADRFGPPRRTPAGSDEAASGEICPQPPSRLDAVMGTPYDLYLQGEDCLSLRITAPAAPAPPRPVLVFFHGGGFSSGSGLLDWYDGSRLSAEGGLVVVSAGYRLGPLGFLRHQGVSEGNLGLLDQLEALRWVRENIARHGGDPDNVTACGQSAGAISLALLLRHPETPRLLRRAILQSPVLELATTLPQQAEEQGAFFTEALAGDPRTATFDELLGARSATAEHVAERTGSRVMPPFGPVLGVPPVPAEPPTAGLDGIDLLVGWTREELTAFGLPPEAARAAEEEAFTRPVAEFARWARAAGARLATYRLDWAPEGSAYGATHCLELPLLLGDEAAWRDSPLLGTVPWHEVDAFGRALRATWAGFARTGRVDPAPTAGYPVRWGENQGVPAD
ncbi:carboxylesterase family protein [Streptomyces sp. NPDC050161]|uniref:carboxylesterase family protein n=1 Tax=Streptomyces sp. NPDC050161 TaxID=3365604 RepID=UPI0037B18BB9